ncbi:MAG: NAD(P)/FAD-dependent oxidoreductase [Paracoccaceae bacterium]
MTSNTETYDVVIIGGAMIGSSIAWSLVSNEDFTGTICVIERDPTYEFASTSRSNSCIRQQYSNELNVKISQYGAQFIRNFGSFINDSEAPKILFQDFGYMYFSDTRETKEVFKKNQEMQTSLGAKTRLMTPSEISFEYPFYNVKDIIVGSHNTLDEGYFDGATIFSWWLKKNKELGVSYLSDEVSSIIFDCENNLVNGVQLKSGKKINCGTLVNAAGTRAAEISEMLGVHLPIEPRRRYSFVFDAEKPLDRPLPLTIDPSGVHVRSDGNYYVAGCPPDQDFPVNYNDFEMDHSIWEDKIWPALVHRIPQFDRLKVINSWVGHYSYNIFDQNAVLGPHPQIKNFIFANGFSGHGLQQSPAVGRGISEIVIYGEYRSLDLSPLNFNRFIEDKPFLERAII